MLSESGALRERLAQICWLGGSPCSGKTSAAEALCARRGWQYYSCDQAFYRHAERISPQAQPTFYRVMRLASEALWMRPVEDLVADELSVYQEEFALILEDLLALPTQSPILAEGAALLPWLVQPLLRSVRQGMWMVPTADFQWEHYSRREWAKDVVKDCSDPARAFENWMARDTRFAERVRSQAQFLGLEVLVVDGRLTLNETSTAVETYLCLE